MTTSALLRKSKLLGQSAEDELNEIHVSCRMRIIKVVYRKDHHGARFRLDLPHHMGKKCDIISLHGLDSGKVIVLYRSLCVSYCWVHSLT